MCQEFDYVRECDIVVAGVHERYENSAKPSDVLVDVSSVERWWFVCVVAFSSCCQNKVKDSLRRNVKGEWECCNVLMFRLEIRGVCGDGKVEGEICKEVFGIFWVEVVMCACIERIVVTRFVESEGVKEVVAVLVWRALRVDLWSDCGDIVLCEFVCWERGF